MGRIQVGDTVAFRRDVVARCQLRGVADFRATVTRICAGWLFLRDAGGCIRVMPAASMCKVARSGVVLELL